MSVGMLSFEDILSLPYGTRIMNVNTKDVYIMYNSLVKEEIGYELGFTYPLVDLALVRSRFNLI